MNDNVQDIATIRDKAEEFQARLLALKQLTSPEEAWYPYSTLGNFFHLERVLTGQNRLIFNDLHRLAIADIGAADGDNAFFLETLGAARVDVIDNPSTNYNGCRGLQRMKDALGSRVSISHIDLDDQFRLPREDYFLVLFLGILYHLKNPFFVLERLAKAAKYCILSTRIARYASDRTTELQNIPVAYLLDPDESNGDATNYWVFSDVGLRRVLYRSGWNVVDYATFGNVSNSDPASVEGDERAFAFLSSRYKL